MEQVEVDLKTRSYQILIGQDILAKTGKELAKLEIAKKIMIISNPLVYGLYGEQVKKSLQASGFEVVVAKIPDGERYKSLKTAAELYDKAVEFGLDRDSSILALGGGVVGDIAGFIAATYMRGIKFIQLPTTLLAQVDSSVGGKVAVNHSQGKNLIGAFYQPEIVIADINVLKTLEERDLKSGISEVIKYGVIWEEEFFRFLEENYAQILALEPEAVTKVVKRSCQIKAEVVAKDEREQGIRAILNYGHTVGHAIEAVTDYDTYRHGEGVAIGMVAAAKLAKKMGLLAKQDLKRQVELIKNFALPTTIPGLKISELNQAMTKDKKVKDGVIRFILAKSLGQVVISSDVKAEDINDILFEMGADK